MHKIRRVLLGAASLLALGVVLISHSAPGASSPGTTVPSASSSVATDSREGVTGHQTEPPYYYLLDGELEKWDVPPHGTTIKVSLMSLAPDLTFDRLLDWRKRRGETHFLLTATASDQSPEIGNTLVEIHGNHGAIITKNVQDARFSPRGDLIAYQTRERRAMISIIDLDGDVLTSFEGASPAWGHSADYIAFVNYSKTFDQDTSTGIALYDLSSSKEVILTRGERDYFPIVHPSGEWILFTSGSRTGIASLFVVSRHGGEVRQLTNVGDTRVTAANVPTPYQRAAWSPDGRFLAYEVKNVHEDPTSIWILEFSPGDFASKLPNLISASPSAIGMSPLWIDDDTFIVHNTTRAFKVEVNR